mmetsp:Transcript_48994/g.59293  ORF Transcript_48994/g.59293 Transcript_48994/m.59293 type:complete len:398 (+) Transcript_48994:918-2111(+)
MLPVVYGAVACGTTTDSASSHLPFTRDIQPITLRPGSNNNSMSLNNTRISNNPKRPLTRINRHNTLRLKCRPKRHRLIPHHRNHRRTRHIHHPRIILNIHTLALQLPSHGRRHDHWLQSRPRRVNGRRYPRGTAANDRHALGEVSRGPTVFELGVVVVFLFHGSVLFRFEAGFEFFEQFVFAREVQVGFVRGAGCVGFGFLLRGGVALGMTIVVGEAGFEGGRRFVLFGEAFGQFSRRLAQAVAAFVAFEHVGAFFDDGVHVLAFFAHFLVIFNKSVFCQYNIVPLRFRNDALRVLTQLPFPSTRKLILFLPVIKKYKRRDAADVIPTAQLINLIRIHFREHGVVLHFLRQLFENGCHHPTRTAPVRVEVHNDGETGFCGMFFDQPVEFVRGPDVSD